MFKDPINSGLVQFEHEFCSRKTTNKIFMYLLAPFMLQNFYKKILNQSYEDVRHFWDQNSQFLLNKIFGTTLCYYFHLPIGRKVFHLPQTKCLFGKLLLSFSATISRFHCAKFEKNSSSGSRVMNMCNLWVPK